MLIVARRGMCDVACVPLLLAIACGTPGAGHISDGRPPPPVDSATGAIFDGGSDASVDGAPDAGPPPDCLHATALAPSLLVGLSPALVSRIEVMEARGDAIFW